MNTVSTDIINYLQYIGCGSFGENLFFGRVPDSNKAPTRLWWIAPTNVDIQHHNVSGEDSLQYQYDVFFRSMSLQDVDEEIFRMTKEIIGSRCYELDNFKTMEVKLASTSKRISMDEENRVYGGLCISVTVYDILNPKA